MRDYLDIVRRAWLTEADVELEKKIKMACAALLTADSIHLRRRAMRQIVGHIKERSPAVVRVIEEARLDGRL